MVLYGRRRIGSREPGRKGIVLDSAKRSHQEIEQLLRAAVEKTRERQLKARMQFQCISAEVPHDSGSDGILLLKNARNDEHQAIEEYQVALKRFTEFILNGIVPDELR